MGIKTIFLAGYGQTKQMLCTQNYHFDVWTLIVICWKEDEMRSLSWAETESCRGNRRLAVPDKSRDDATRPSNINFGWRTQQQHFVSSFLASFLVEKNSQPERDFRQAVFAVLGPAGLSSPVPQASVSQVSNRGVHCTVLWRYMRVHMVGISSLLALQVCKTDIHYSAQCAGSQCNYQEIHESTHGKLIFSCLKIHCKVKYYSQLVM